jgi:hypothetical protein
MVKVNNEKRKKGLYFNVLWFRIVILPAVSIIVGLLLALIATLTINWVASYFNSEFKVNFLIFLALAVLGGTLNYKSGGGTFTVPNQHVAVLTLLGKRLDWHLQEGIYPEFGATSVFGRSKEVKNGFTTDASHPNGPGFVNMGIIPFQIWNDRADKKQILENIARNSSTVFASLLLEVMVFYPRKVLDSGDPLLSLAERARTSFRTAISFFIDRDNASVKTILVKLMVGQTIVTSFVNKKGEAYFDQGAMVKNRGGTAMYLPVEDNNGATHHSPAEAKADYDRRVRETKTVFRKNLEEEADEIMYENLPKKKNGEVVVEDKSVEDSLEEVLDSIGTYLKNASVSNIQYSEIVREEANQAASESFKSKSMKDSARAQADSEVLLMKRRAESGTDQADDFDRAVIAAQDNPGSVKIIHTSGKGSELSKAAAIISGKDDK